MGKSIKDKIEINQLEVPKYKQKPTEIFLAIFSLLYLMSLVKVAGGI